VPLDAPKQPKPTTAKPPIQPWAWAFAVACGIIPVLTLGGAIPGAIGFGGAGGCIAVGRNDQMSVAARLAACAGITVGCWVLVVLLVGGIAMFRTRA
jgi:hypothetical protein